ncbi:MAG: hypothetical protein SVW77_02675 [Candidatus Nanohaloarchaea archaeon]|nr:hypothetical protein [Candidatus Nanohaloarchaea archaeon]
MRTRPRSPLKWFSRRSGRFSTDQLASVLVLIIVGTVVIAAVGGPLRGALTDLLNALTGPQFPPTSLASAKVTCAAINHVYGDEPTSGWVTAAEVTGPCTGELINGGATGSITASVTGAVSAITGGHPSQRIRFRCSEGMGRASVDAGGGAVGCEIQNFELPQEVPMEAIYVPGKGDPNHILYYGKYPSYDAQAWNQWAAINLALTLVPVGKLVKSGRAIVKGIGRGTRWVTPGGRVIGRSVNVLLRPLRVGRTAVDEAAGRITSNLPSTSEWVQRGIISSGEKSATLRTAIRKYTALGYHRLKGERLVTGLMRGSRQARFVAGSSDWLVRRTESAYRFSLRGLVYAGERNGWQMWDEAGSRAIVEHLHSIGKISDETAAWARGQIDDGYRIQQILTDQEKQFLDDVDPATGGLVTREMQIDRMVEEGKVVPVTREGAEQLSRTMGISRSDRVSMLLPKFLLVSHGTTSVDEFFAMSGEGSASGECALFLWNQEGDNRRFPIENCERNNAHNLKTGIARPPNTGVSLIKSREATISGGGTIPSPRGPISVPSVSFDMWQEQKGRFYTASPCLSRTDKPDQRVSAPTGVEMFHVYPDTADRQVQIEVPVAAANYRPNFCWQYVDPGETIFNPIRGVINEGLINALPVSDANTIKQGLFDLGLAPWPCHGYSLSVINYAEFVDKLRSYGLGFLLDQATGTCGSAEPR